MFRRLIMAIFRLYMKYLLSSYTKYIWATYMGWGRGVKWARDLVSVRTVGTCGLHGGPCCYQAMSKLIIVIIVTHTHTHTHTHTQTLYISYFKEHSGDNEPHDPNIQLIDSS